jgi:hypothetical protein
MAPDPDMEWKRLAVTGLGLGLAATITTQIQTKWFTGAAGINPAYLKLLIGYVGINYGDRAGKNMIGENLPDFGAGIFLDGARDLVVQYIVPSLLGVVSPTPAAAAATPTAAEFAALQKRYAAFDQTYGLQGARII